jgi:hypothetical protein
VSHQIRIEHDDDQLNVIAAVNKALREHNLEFVDDGEEHEGFAIFTLGNIPSRGLDWHMLHVNSCDDASCKGCKFCKRCEAEGRRDLSGRQILTRCVGFEDHLCFNCRHPPSD